MGFVNAEICNKFLSERFLGPGCAGPDYSSVKGLKGRFRSQWLFWDYQKAPLASPRTRLFVF